MVILYRWNRSALQFQVELRVFLNWRNIQRFWDDLEWIFQSFRLLHRSVKYYLKRYSLCISPRQSNQNIRQTVWHVLTYVCMYICMHEQHKPTAMCSGGAQSNEYVRACIYTFTYWRKYLSIEERCNWCAITSIRCRLMHTNTQILYLTKI